MNIRVGVSNRHVHLTEDDYRILFGEESFEKVKDLVQPGEFSSNQKVTLSTPKAKIFNVRVLGPFRPYTQVEVSKTDCYVLGLDPPIRNSGELDGSEEITIIGSQSSVKRNACIVATRHIHMTKEDREKMGLMNQQVVRVRVGREKKAILEDVYLKEAERASLELHLDTDDANANFVKNGDMAEIID